MKRILCILLAISLAMLTYPATGAINTIGAGGTVFLGEQGLDISGAVGSNNQIAWFPSTAQTMSSTPEKTLDISSLKGSFSVSPMDFSSRTGNWYCWSGGAQTVGTTPIAFMVADPYLSIKVRDVDVDVDATNKWLYRGDSARFRIETNLYTMTQRGVAGAPVTIYVQSPDGALYSSLLDTTGTSRSLVISVPSSPYEVPGVLWDTGNAQYGAGTYTIWAECTANRMKDNYPQPGKAVSEKISVLVQQQNPLISKTVQTPVPTTTPTTVGTTRTAASIVMTTTPPPPTPSLTTPAPEITPAESANPVPATSLMTVTSPMSSGPTRSPGFDLLPVIVAGCIAGIIYGTYRR